MGAIRIGFLVLFFLSGLPAATLVERALDSLEWRHPLPQGNDLYSAAYGNGRYVIVGRRGVVLSSTDAMHWTVRHDGRTNDLLRVTFADGKFVAVGNFGSIFVSTNGIDWQGRFVNPTHHLISVAYGNGVWVVGTWSDTTIYTSPDAVNWSLGSASGSMDDVAFGAGRFVAATGARAPITSVNGRDWSLGTLPSQPFAVKSITYGNGRFVLGAGNYVATSEDGVNWIEGSVSGFAGDMAAGGGVFVRLQGTGSSRYNRVYSQGIFRSTDGLSWTPVLAYSNYLYGANFAGDRFFALGNNGVFFSSTDGANWQQQSFATENNFRGIAHGNGRYVAVGNAGSVFTSDDGAQWTGQPLGWRTNNLRGVVHAHGAFFAVSGEEIITSMDGKLWRESEEVDQTLLNIAYVGDRLIAVGHSGTTLVYLTNRFGPYWGQPSTPTLQRLQGVAYGNGLYVVTGDNGVILTSPDALSWTLRPTGTNWYLQGAAYGNGRFVAVGAGRGFGTSENGTNWTFHAKPVNMEFESIIFAQGHFVVVGEDGTVLSSTNGLDWKRHQSGSHNNLRNVVYAEGAFTIVGNNDAILQSAQVLPLLRVSRRESDVEVRIRAMADTLYYLQASPDLRSWEDVFIFQNSQEETVFLDSEAAYHRNRFYRVGFEPE